VGWSDRSPGKKVLYILHFLLVDVFLTFNRFDYAILQATIVFSGLGMSYWSAVCSDRVPGKNVLYILHFLLGPARLFYSSMESYNVEKSLPSPRTTVC
jgi:hypothetical protein